MNGSVALKQAKKYTEESLLGGGAVVGKNVTISSITPIDGGNRVTFSYTLDDGTVKTSAMDVMDGIDGVAGKDGLNGKDGDDGISISKVEKINTVDLVDTYRITFSDNTFFDYSVTNGVQGIKGEKGDQGEQGVQGVQGIKGDKGDDGYPFLIYKEYSDISEFNKNDFPEIGLMFMVKSDSTSSYPVYRYTGDTTTPYSHVTNLEAGQGIKGDKGDKGDTGEQGVAGENGKDGITYTPVIGTVVSGTTASASVTINDDTYTAAFDFVIPKGDKGDAGECIVDDALSNTSENAVQNKVIKSYVDNSLANIQSTLNSKASSADVYTKSETDTKITEKVAEIVAGAPADFDTLKEMSDWIANHEGSAAAMNSAINANAENIASIQSKIGDIESEIIRADDADSEGKCQLYKTVNGERVDIEPKVNVSSTDIADLKNMIYPTLEVSTDAEYEITFSCGDRIITGTPDDDNTLTKKLPLLGTWKIYPTVSKGSYYKTIEASEIGGSYSVEILYPTLEVTGASGCEITFTCGDIIIKGTPGEDNKVSTKLPALGVWTVTSVIDGTTYTKTINVDNADKTYPLRLVTSIYGVIWDGSSSTTFTRTDDAAGFENPTPALNGVGGSSPFDDCYPWSDIEKVTIDGNAMVKIPKFWYKITKDGNSLKYQIADIAVEGFNVSPAHADRGDGVGERDYVYIGRYKCTSSSYKSVTNTELKTSVTRATARSGITSLGSGYYMQDFALWWTVRMLYLVEFADWNSQAVIGYGCGNGSSTVKTGTTDSMSYHTGTMQSTRTTYGTGVQYRWIEDPWGNANEWCDGIRFSDSDIYVYNKPSEYSDTSGGTKTGTRPATGGYISQWSVPSVSGYDWALYPSAVGGSDSTEVADYCGYGNPGVVLQVGGCHYQRQYYGAFYLTCNSAATTGSTVGARLQYLP